MSKRQLRSDTTAGAAAPPPLTNLSQPPAAKRQRKNEPIRFLCYACDEEKTAGRFPDYNPSSECEHLINTCKDCLKQWTQTQIEEHLFITGGEDGKTFGIKCPQCDAMMRKVNIELATTKKFRQLFEERERHHFAEITPGWRWCMAPGCRAGQIHQKKEEPKEEAKEEIKQEDGGKENANAKPKGKKKAKSKPENLSVKEVEAKADICTCKECGAKACVTCDRPWHQGETCEEYQARTKDHMDEEDKTIKAISRLSKKCPGCQRNIQKNGGCTSMHCFACGTHFCWTCVSAMRNGRCNCYRDQQPQPQAPGWMPRIPAMMRIPGTGDSP